MHQPIYRSNRHLLVHKDVFPVAEGLVASDQHAPALIPFTNELKEDAGLKVVSLHVPKIVKYETVILVQFVKSRRKG